jgi:hypothetical protein
MKFLLDMLTIEKSLGISDQLSFNGWNGKMAIGFLKRLEYGPQFSFTCVVSETTLQVGFIRLRRRSKEIRSEILRSRTSLLREEQQQPFDESISNLKGKDFPLKSGPVELKESNLIHLSGYVSNRHQIKG